MNRKVVFSINKNADVPRNTPSLPGFEQSREKCHIFYHQPAYSSRTLNHSQQLIELHSQSQFYNKQCIYTERPIYQMRLSPIFNAKILT